PFADTSATLRYFDTSTGLSNHMLSNRKLSDHTSATLRQGSVTSSVTTLSPKQDNTVLRQLFIVIKNNLSVGYLGYLWYNILCIVGIDFPYHVYFNNSTVYSFCIIAYQFYDLNITHSFQNLLYDGV